MGGAYVEDDKLYRYLMFWCQPIASDSFLLISMIKSKSFDETDRKRDTVFNCIRKLSGMSHRFSAADWLTSKFILTSCCWSIESLRVSTQSTAKVISGHSTSHQLTSKQINKQTNGLPHYYYLKKVGKMKLNAPGRQKLSWVPSSRGSMHSRNMTYSRG